MGNAVDLINLRSITDGDSAMEREFIAAFVEQSDKNLATLATKIEIAGKDTIWSETAHILKGGAGNLGAAQLQRLCAEAQNFDGPPDERAILFGKIEKEYDAVLAALRQSGLLA